MFAQDTVWMPMHISIWTLPKSKYWMHSVLRSNSSVHSCTCLLLHAWLNVLLSWSHPRSKTSDHITMESVLFLLVHVLVPCYSGKGTLNLGVSPKTWKGPRFFISQDRKCGISSYGYSIRWARPCYMSIGYQSNAVCTGKERDPMQSRFSPSPDVDWPNALWHPFDIDSMVRADTFVLMHVPVQTPLNLPISGRWIGS